MATAFQERVRPSTASQLGRLGFLNRPLDKGLVAGFTRTPDYAPRPVRACECGIVLPATEREGQAILRTQVLWRPCTSFGQLDGDKTFPLEHVRIGTDDYLLTALQLRACARPGEPRAVFPPFPGEIRDAAARRRAARLLERRG